MFELNLELAKAEGLNSELANTIFTLLIAGVIAISIKIVGILLITGLLILTNQLQALGYYLLNIFPFLQNFG